MKKKQYTTKQQAEIAAKIIKKAVEISNTTPHDVFCYYLPHVDWIELHIHPGGWVSDGDWTEVKVSFKEYSDTEEEIAEAMAALDELQKDAEK